jgi:hypothetical protein
MPIMLETFCGVAGPDGTPRIVVRDVPSGDHTGPRAGDVGGRASPRATRLGSSGCRKGTGWCTAHQPKSPSVSSRLRGAASCFPESFAPASPTARQQNAPPGFTGGGLQSCALEAACLAHVTLPRTQLPPAIASQKPTSTPANEERQSGVIKTTSMTTASPAMAYRRCRANITAGSATPKAVSASNCWTVK